ncbi:electron transfer flavoprotein subunit beta/FixA family protein [Chloroflexota bacterium]
MNIIVCVKQVLDPELPPTLFRVNPDTNKVIPPRGRTPVLSTFDENALEAALKLKDVQDAKITVISMGSGLDDVILRETLAVGADDLIFLEDDAFKDIDSNSSAAALAAAIQKIGEYDIILCGRQAADTDAGLVGPGIAEILGIPSITLAIKIEASDGKLKVERLTDDGRETIEAPMPALVTAGYEIGNIREASFQATMEADEKEITYWDAQELGIDLSQSQRHKMIKLFIPESEGSCEFIEAESLEKAGEILAQKLRDTQVL